MPLGSFDLRMPHGLAIGITLPYVMRFNAPARPERYAEIAAALGEPIAGLPLREAAARAAEAVAALARDIGIPARLSQAGMREEHIEPVAAEAIKSGNVAVNPRRATLEDLKAILEEAF